MKIFIRKKHLVVPVGTYATNKKLCFYESAGSEKTLVMDFDCTDRIFCGRKSFGRPVRWFPWR